MAAVDVSAFARRRGALAVLQGVAGPPVATLPMPGSWLRSPIRSPCGRVAWPLAVSVAPRTVPSRRSWPRAMLFS
eukprot:4848456-Alexandrium_andersonii.AAC.1